MSWTARDEEIERNKARGDQLLHAAGERVYMILVERYGGPDQINQTELAPKFGVSQPTLSSWIAYYSRKQASKAYLPNARNLLLMPEVLGVSPLWLFYGIGEPTDAVEPGPSPNQRAALQAQYRLLQRLHEWATDRETEIVAALHKEPAAEVADTIAAARHAAVPVPRGADRTPDSHGRPAGGGDGHPAWRDPWAGD